MIHEVMRVDRPSPIFLALINCCSEVLVQVKTPENIIGIELFTESELGDGEFEVAKCDHKQWGVIGV